VLRQALPRQIGGRKIARANTEFKALLAVLWVMGELEVTQRTWEQGAALFSVSLREFHKARDLLELPHRSYTRTKKATIEAAEALLAGAPPEFRCRVAQTLDQDTLLNIAAAMPAA
jgi:hypothetical protein